MSNFYNNNNQGSFYNNQNNNMYRPGQNFYSNNNYNRPQGNYNQNQNQNQFNNNYQGQIYNNQNQQNNGPKPFISAYMGRILIKSETLETFSKNLKSTEWTTNPNYLQAKDIDIKTKLNLKGQLQSDINIPPNRFNDYNLGSNSNFNNINFITYIKEINENNNKQKKQIEEEKNNFMRNNFPNEDYNMRLKDLYIKIGLNRKDVIKKDYSLYGKVEKLIPLLKPIEVPKNWGKKEDMGAPSGPKVGSQNSGKIYSNTPGF